MPDTLSIEQFTADVAAQIASQLKIDTSVLVEKLVASLSKNLVDKIIINKAAVPIAQEKTKDPNPNQTVGKQNVVAPLMSKAVEDTIIKHIPLLNERVSELIDITKKATQDQKKEDSNLKGTMFDSFYGKFPNFINQFKTAIQKDFKIPKIELPKFPSFDPLLRAFKDFKIPKFPEKEKKEDSGMFNMLKRPFEFLTAKLNDLSKNLKPDEREKEKKEEKDKEKQAAEKPKTFLEGVGEKRQFVVIDGFTSEGIRQLKEELPDIIKLGFKDLFEHQKGEKNKTGGEQGSSDSLGFLDRILARAGRAIWSATKSITGGLWSLSKFLGRGALSVAGNVGRGALALGGQAAGFGTAGAAVGTAGAVAGGLVIGSEVGRQLNKALMGEKEFEQMEKELGGRGLWGGVKGIGKLIKIGIEKEKTEEKTKELEKTLDEKIKKLGFKDLAEYQKSLRDKKAKAEPQPTEEPPPKKYEEVPPKPITLTTAKLSEAAKPAEEVAKPRTTEELLKKENKEDNQEALKIIKETKDKITSVEEVKKTRDSLIRPEEQTPKIKTEEGVVTDKSTEQLSKLVQSSESQTQNMANLVLGFNTLAKALEKLGVSVAENPGNTTNVFGSNKSPGPVATGRSSEFAKAGDPTISQFRSFIEQARQQTF